MTGSCSMFSNCCSSLLMFIGRLCIATIFILSGMGKFFDFETTASYMASKGMNTIPLFLYTAAFIEVLCGLSLVLGWKTRWGAFILLLFLIPTTYIFHDFWNLISPEKEMMMIHFLKNLAIFGGLLYIVATGAGAIAIDRLCCRKGSDDAKGES